MGKGYRLFDYDHMDKYLGGHIACRKGYATAEEIRKNASSGGMVTALLCHLLQSGQIDGAFVTKSVIRNGKLSYQAMVATTQGQLKDCSSSIYMDMPLLRHLDLIRNFNGKVAIVLVPCMMRALAQIMETDDVLREKIVLKLGLYCCGNYPAQATLLPLEKEGISLQNAVRIYYKRGHWRGFSTVVYEDGTEKNFSYAKTCCAYRNAYFFEKEGCMVCQDHFNKSADISFGDVWLKKMKKNPVKHTGCIIRNEKAYEMYRSAVEAGAITDSAMSESEVVDSQRRALVFKFNCAKAKKHWYEKAGKNISIDTSAPCRLNHRLAFFLARKNAGQGYRQIRRYPMGLVYYYMCFIRVLLSF